MTMAKVEMKGLISWNWRWRLRLRLSSNYQDYGLWVTGYGRMGVLRVRC